jgi:hypothetical protein
MKAPLATAVAIITGLLVLLGYFVPVPALVQLRTLLLGWAVILVAIATVVGILNLFQVHWHKLTRKPGRDVYSLVFLLAFVLTIGVGLWFGPASPEFQQLMLSVQMPAESSLMALLAIVLAYSSLRLLQRRKGALAVMFIFSAVIFLILSSGLLAAVETVSPVKEIIAVLNRLPVAGARGILLGIALGSLVAGIRILMGADRPYRG